jgi:deazaflavin-dependent oxidoreductase (nitroreductase family)
MELSAEQWRELNSRIIEEFRENGGKCGGAFEGNPMLLLTTVGARSGESRVTPLTFHPDAEHYVVMASKGGAPEHPSWYHNLVANPDVVLEVGSDRFEGRAAEATDSERDRLYASMVEALPRFGEYQAGVERQIPIIVLSPK